MAPQMFETYLNLTRRRLRPRSVPDPLDLPSADREARARDSIRGTIRSLEATPQFRNLVLSFHDFQMEYDQSLKGFKPRIPSGVGKFYDSVGPILAKWDYTDFSNCGDRVLMLLRKMWSKS